MQPARRCWVPYMRSPARLLAHLHLWQHPGMPPPRVPPLCRRCTAGAPPAAGCGGPGSGSGRAPRGGAGRPPRSCKLQPWQHSAPGAPHTWSESSTGTPSSRSQSQTVDLPMAIPAGGGSGGAVGGGGSSAAAELPTRCLTSCQSQDEWTHRRPRCRLVWGADTEEARWWRALVADSGLCGGRWSRP